MLMRKCDSQLANEEIVRRAAKELAKLHICDVLLATIEELKSELNGLSSDHRNPKMTEEAKDGGKKVARFVMDTLLDTAPISYRDLIDEANEDGDEVDEDTIQDDVREYAEAIMAQWVKS